MHNQIDYPEKFTGLNKLLITINPIDAFIQSQVDNGNWVNIAKNFFNFLIFKQCNFTNSLSTLLEDILQHIKPEEYHKIIENIELKDVIQLIAFYTSENKNIENFYYFINKNNENLPPQKMSIDFLL